MFDGRWRHAVDRGTQPVGKVLVRAHITADVITGFGLIMSVVTAVVVGSGHLLIGVALLFPTGLPDLFDGPVAKASGTASVRGAFLDSVADRVVGRILVRRRGVVSRGAPRRSGGPAAVRHLGGHLAHLVPEGQGRAARPDGARRPDGAGGEVHPSRAVLHCRRRLDFSVHSVAVGLSRSCARYCARQVRQGRPGGRGTSSTCS